MNTKICTKCKKEKPRSNYYNNGCGRVHSMCDPCRAKYQKRYQEKQKKRKNLYG